MAHNDRDPYQDMTDDEYERLAGPITGDRRFAHPQNPERAIEQMVATMRRIFGEDFGRGEAA